MFFRSFFVAYLITPIVIKISHKFKILDLPDERKMHTQPTPRLGGVAIFFTVLLLTINYFKYSTELTGVIIATSIIFLVGLYDDIKGFKASTKLLAQILATLILIKFGVMLSFVPHWPGEHLIEAVITIIWIIGITNAINFLDGIDGLCAGLGVVCMTLFFIIGWHLRQTYLAYLTIALTGACVGFLPYNYRFLSGKRASIFLGDSGSTVIGFLLASVAVMGSWAVKDPVVSFSTPLLVLGVPIFDMIYTTISRFKNGSVRTIKEWLEFVGKDHFHHRLVTLGLLEKHAVMFILLITFCLGLGAIVIRQLKGFWAIFLLLQSIIIFFIITILMRLGRQRD